jgi:CRISPR-associated protein Cas1
MADGRLQHREVDKPSGEIPNDAIEPFSATAVYLTGPKIGITCRLDLLEGKDGMVTPVEYKRGEAPDVPFGAYEAERVQLCAEGLALLENGFKCREGAVYYLRSSRRVPIAFDEALIGRTAEIISDVRLMIKSNEVPPPLQDSPKCNGCSLAGACLPDEVNLIKAIEAEDKARQNGELPLRAVCTENDGKMPVYVVGQGHVVRKRGDRLEIWTKEEKVSEVRLMEVSQLSLYGGVEITTPAMVELMQRGAPVLHFTHGGWFMGIATGTVHCNVELRKRQFSMALDEAQSLCIARAIVSGKIKNCRALLRRSEQLHDPTVLETLERLSKDAESAQSIEQLRGFEGAAAANYFSGLSEMLSKSIDVSFEHRNKRPPRDPVNAVMSYLYGMLVKDAFVTLQAVGFDPYMGFYHQPRLGRPSLALDLMEEFRSAIADSVALALFNNRELTADDFPRVGVGVAIDPEAKRRVVAGYENRMATEVRHPIFGYKVSYRRVLEIQSRLLARHLFGEIAAYPPFLRR